MKTKYNQYFCSAHMCVLVAIINYNIRKFIKKTGNTKGFRKGRPLNYKESITANYKFKENNMGFCHFFFLFQRDIN